MEWTSHTPVFLPKHLRYKKPIICFSWKKVLKKEKNGLFALFLLICLFRIIDDLAAGQFLLKNERWSISAAILSGLIYVVLKFLKKNTSVLDETDR